MPDFSLMPGPVVYAYDVNGQCTFSLEGEHAQAKSFYIEHDPNHPEEYACQIVTTDGASVIYEGRDKGVWPPVAKRLYEKHRRLTGRNGRHA